MGGGGGLASHFLPGDFERGRGDLWQASRELKWLVFLASKFGGLFSRVDSADFHGKTFWRVILAGPFGGSFWHIYLVGLPQEKKNKLLSKRIEVKEMYNQ